MIEKLLKPFISDHAKLILEAMEKVGGDAGKRGEYWLDHEYTRMYDAAKDSEGIISRVVLTRAFIRLDSTYKRASARTYAANIAAQILMGTSFEPEEEEKTGSQSAAMNQAMRMSLAGVQQAGLSNGSHWSNQGQYISQNEATMFANADLYRNKP